jgi:hypothetical protein
MPNPMQDNLIAKDCYVTAFFGVLSAAMGLIALDTPGYEESQSDLREIGLLLCLFHISNPIFIIPLCLLTLLGVQFDMRLLAVFIMHLVPLFFTWYVYKWIERKHLSNIRLGFSWCLVTIGYYTILLYPLLIVSYNLVGLYSNLNFIESYKTLFVSGTFEMVTTTLISSLYLVQLSIRRSVELTNKGLEEVVRLRTQELSNANFELTVVE